MSAHVRQGMIFGQLTVVEIIPGKVVGKPKARCRCSCGSVHITGTTQLIHRRAHRCKSCSQRLPEGEAAFRKRLDGYRGNARHRKREFLLTAEQFRALHDAACVYCGVMPAKGVDRKDNAIDYLPENCAPCCKQCNLAKRDMNQQEFFSWLRRLTEHQRAWL